MGTIRLSSILSFGVVLTLGSHAAAQSLSQKVTYATAGTTAFKAVAELSRQSRFAMRAELPVAKEIVTIKVKDAPLNTLMEKLAKATCGKWEKVGEGFVLKQDQDVVAAQESADLQTRTILIQKSIQKQADSFLKAKSFTSADAEKLLRDINDLTERMRNMNDQVAESLYQKQAELQSSSPIGRLMVRCLMAMNPRDLATLPPDMRFVYATDPTPMQRPLGDDAYQALSDFANEYSVWSDAVAKLPKNSDGGFSFGFDSAGFFPLKSKPVKVLIAISRWRGSSGLEADLTVVDSRGKYVAQSNAMVGNDFEDPNAGKKPPAIDIDPHEQTIEMTREGKVLLSLLRAGYMNGGTGFQQSGLRRLSPDLQEVFLHPEDHEPLSILSGIEVTAIADANHEQLVAVLPDSMLSSSGVDAGPISPSRLRLQFQQLQIVKFEDADGWLTVTPANPVDSRASRTDRSVMGNFLRQVATSGRPTLDNLAGYALQEPAAAADSLGIAWLAMLFPDGMSGLELNNWDLVRFFGTLSQQDRAALLAGKSIPMATLTPDQRSYLTRLVFYHQAMGLELDDQNVNGAVDVTDGADISYGDISTEATQVLPNGLPSNGQIALDNQKEQVVVPTASGPYSNPMTSQELGTQLAMRERPDLYPWVNEIPDFGKFSFGDRLQYNFKFELTNHLIQTYQLNDLRSSAGQAMALNELPDDFRKLVEKARDEMRQAQKDMKAGENGFGAGQKNPPPNL